MNYIFKNFESNVKEAISNFLTVRPRRNRKWKQETGETLWGNMEKRKRKWVETCG